MAALDDFLSGKTAPRFELSMETMTIIQLALAILIVIILGGIIVKGINRAIEK